MLQVVKDRRQISQVLQTRRPPSRSNKSGTIPNKPGFDGNKSNLDSD